MLEVFHLGRRGDEEVIDELERLVNHNHRCAKVEDRLPLCPVERSDDEEGLRRGDDEIGDRGRERERRTEKKGT